MPSGPASERWLEAFGGPLAAVLDGISPKARLSLLRPPRPVADDVTKLLLRRPEGSPKAVVLCASPVSPDLVARNMARAREAKQALGVSLGGVILSPLAEGRWEGLSYAVLPYRAPLSESRWRWFLQRRRVAGQLLAWLRAVTARTVRSVDAESLRTDFIAPLEHLGRMPEMSDRLRRAASRAADRARRGAWVPCYVLAHNDFWKGNILRDPARRGFVVIDWAGSRLRGFALFDLLRLARSFRIGNAPLRAELGAQCRILGCGIDDAGSHVAAALASLAEDLEHFPLADFALMADSCLEHLEEALA